MGDEIAKNWLKLKQNEFKYLTMAYFKGLS